MNLLWIFYLSLTILHRNFVSASVQSISISITMNGFTAVNSVNEGATVELKCSAICTTSTPCAYSWSGPVTSQTHVLTISSVSRSHKDKEFKCTAKDNGDSLTKSDMKSFDVYYGPDNVTVASGTSLTVVEGDYSDKQNLVCEANGCNPTCGNFTWKKDGKTVSATKKLFPTNKKILRDDAGNYTCTAENGKTPSKSAMISITVKYAPSVTLTWDRNETLKCKATGNPANYTFQKMEQYVDNIFVKSYDKQQQSGDTATFRLRNISYQNTGTYVCYVHNGIKNHNTGNGTQNGSTQVNVKDRPVLISSEGSYNVSKGSALAILMTLYSNPEANESYIDTPMNNHTTTEWKIEDVQVEFYGKNVTIGGQKLNILFSEVLEEHFTTFTVDIGNTVGSISTNVTIHPEGPPDIPTRFSKSEISSDSAAFTLVTGFYNGAEQTIVVEHRPEGNQSEWSSKTRKNAGEEKGRTVKLVVSDLIPETVYEFRSYAYNVYNSSGYTEVIKGKTEKAPLSGAAIAGIVIGCVGFIVLVAAAGFLIVRYRRKPKDIDGGTYTEQNKDLTLEMPTSPVYENKNVCTKEPSSPDTPTNIYENTNMTVGYSPHASHSNKTGLYDSPRSNEGPVDNKKELYDKPRPNAGPFDSSRSDKARYDSPRSNAGKKVFYDSPRSNAGPFDTSRSEMELYDNPSSNAGKKVFYDSPRSNAGPFDSSRSKMELYDNPRSQATDTGDYRNDKSENGGTVPPYLDLNNPQAVEEAYLDVNQSKMLLPQSSSKSELAKQETVTEDDYLDMNEVQEVQKSSRNTTQKENPYANAQKGRKETDSVIGDDYQNVAKYKKTKGESAKGYKPYQNMDADKSKSEDAADEGLKGYQNANKFKQQSSVESNSELYMAMSIGDNRQSVVSMPEYQAPPPPVPIDEPLEEENYMNLRMGKPK